MEPRVFRKAVEADIRRHELIPPGGVLNLGEIPPPQEVLLAGPDAPEATMRYRTVSTWSEAVWAVARSRSVAKE